MFHLIKDVAYTVLPDADVLTFTPEILTDAATGFMENAGRIGTVALCAFLLVAGIYALFNQIQNGFR